MITGLCRIDRSGGGGSLARFRSVLMRVFLVHTQRSSRRSRRPTLTAGLKPEAFLSMPPNQNISARTLQCVCEEPQCFVWARHGLFQTEAEGPYTPATTPSSLTVLKHTRPKQFQSINRPSALLDLTMLLQSNHLKPGPAAAAGLGGAGAASVVVKSSAQAAAAAHSIPGDASFVCERTQRSSRPEEAAERP